MAFSAVYGAPLYADAQYALRNTVTYAGAVAEMFNMCDALNFSFFTPDILFTVEDGMRASPTQILSKTLFAAPQGGRCFTVKSTRLGIIITENRNG